jgi:hypothetical protein
MEQNFFVKLLLLVAGNCGRGRGVIPSLAGRGSSLSSVGITSLKCSVLECGQVYSTVRCVAGNVFCSGSSSQRQDSKRTAAHAPKQCLTSARPKLSATNSTYMWADASTPATVGRIISIWCMLQICSSPTFEILRISLAVLFVYYCYSHDCSIRKLTPGVHVLWVGGRHFSPLHSVQIGFLAPSSLLHNGYRGSILVVKRSERQANHSSLFTAEAKSASK